MISDKVCSPFCRLSPDVNQSVKLWISGATCASNCVSTGSNIFPIVMSKPWKDALARSSCMLKLPCATSHPKTAVLLISIAAAILAASSVNVLKCDPVSESAACNERCRSEEHTSELQSQFHLV